MDWDRVIRMNREALLRLVATLYATLGVPVGGSAGTVPRHLHSLVFRLLRPAESAFRRLIVIAVYFHGLRGRTLRRVASGEMPEDLPRGTGARIPTFRLLDPMKRFDVGPPHTVRGPEPRLHFFDGSDPGIEPVIEPPIPSPDDPVRSAQLCRRIQALHAALEDLPRQARRLARWQARVAAFRRENPTKPVRLSPFRPGWPPGHRSKPIHSVDEVLASLHGLARHTADLPDTS